MSNNMQRLGATLSNRMKKTAAGAVPVTIELGIVNSNLSITTDSLQAPIPKGDYMVNFMLTGSFYTSTESHTHVGGAHAQYSGSGYHSHSDGEHEHGIRGIEPGDRILVAWCGYEPVVIAVLEPSTSITYSSGDSPSQGGTGGNGSGTTGSEDTGSDGAGGSGTEAVSPTVVVTPITGGNRVTITDVNGVKTFDVMDGVTPKKGTDYFTAEEVEAIVQEVVDRVLTALGDKFYNKEQIDAMFVEKVVTGEEMLSLVTEVFGEK